jgi:hypothetical protein
LNHYMDCIVRGDSPATTASTTLYEYNPHCSWRSAKSVF